MRSSMTKNKIPAFIMLAVLLFISNNKCMALDDHLLSSSAEGQNNYDNKLESQLRDAQLLIDNGKNDAAIYLLQQVEKDNPENYEVLFRLGEMAIKVRNWAYAIDVFRKASFLLPEDIDVRLILMDVYRAYQMPLQEMIVAKEILTLDLQHVAVTKRLAGLYQAEAMLDDEVISRQRLKKLAPRDYENLKRLAEIYDESGQLWEAARIYEQIREYYPDNIKDMRRLAAIYGKLGESFRQLQVLDHIAENGGSRRWMQKRALSHLKKEINVISVYDPFQASLALRKENADELDITSIDSGMKYLHTRFRSSLDLGMQVKYSRDSHAGKGDLDGTMDIDSAKVLLHAVKNWRGQDYRLEAGLGGLWDSVSGRLYPRDLAAGINASDYPFLQDPTFKSYGGDLLIARLLFLAQPGLKASYGIKYERGQMPDLEARLRMYYYNKAALSYAYRTTDQTELHLQADKSFISDENSRVHGLASVRYTLWGNNPMYDFRGKRKDFFQFPLLTFLKGSYTVEYFKDREKSVYYETFEDEVRQKIQLEFQKRLYHYGLDQNIFLSLQGAYSEGKTLDYQRNGGAKLFYFDSDLGKEIGLIYAYERSRLKKQRGQSKLIGGITEINEISLLIKWFF